MTFPILTSLVVLPIAGAIALFFMQDDGHEAAPVRKVALVVSMLVFAETILLWTRFNPASADFQFTEHYAWIPAFGISYFVGVDGISLLLLVLTGFLTPIAFGSWQSVHSQQSHMRGRANSGAMIIFIRSICFCSVFGTRC